MEKLISTVAQRILDGGEITREEAFRLSEARGAEIQLLAAYANLIRERFTGNRVDLCSIISTRTGKCPEDCAFCAQSVHHQTQIATHDLLDENFIVARAKEMEKAGAHRFDIVISGLGVTEEDPDFRRILRIFARLRKETNLELCACLGTLTEKVALQLKEVGVTRYNHNLETSESFFPEVVTTHSYQERLQTIKNAKAAGLEICCGGIIGMGESMAQRIEFAFTLKELDVDAVPINVLNPIKGTKLENQPPLPPTEILHTFALFRFILPAKNLRYAGGREVNLRDLQALGLMAGLNGMLVGNYLTTTGRPVEEDLQMIKDLGLEF
ncbi:biotin synthase BioB [Calderihabitans maritimus]|uniref:Biotin synthase n=1 Tax=Calderihabitans maritimus TaxID=1246530 RepID=A0A1Z5HN33_9FIRM|nr:biotin synthase BioB [Calderihabitans maritimus]GAW90929.1 biotin synthase [Calderihabitans maritimus]